MKKHATILAVLLTILPLAVGAAENGDTAAHEKSPVLQYNTDGAMSEAALRNERRNPCAGKLGAALRSCIITANRLNINYGSRKTNLLKNQGSSSRRITALQERAKRKRSVFDSPSDPGKLVDLSERILTPARLIEYVGNPAQYEKIDSGPLVRRRSTRITDRRSLASRPICSRRDGLQLIHCLQELGVEISPQTVDPRTYEIYNRVYVR